MRTRLIPVFLLLAVLGYHLGGLLESHTAEKDSPRRLLRHQGRVVDFAGGVMALAEGATVRFYLTYTAGQIGSDLETAGRKHGRLSPDGSAYCWVEGTQLKVLDVHRGRPRSQVELEQKAECWGLSRGGARALLALVHPQHLEILVVDTRKGKTLFSREFAPDLVKSVVLAGSGKTVAIGTAGGVELVKVSNGRAKRLQQSPSLVSSEHRGSWFAAQDGPKLLMRSFSNGRRVMTPLKCGGELALVRGVDQVGGRVGLWRGDHRMQVWDLRSGSLVDQRYSYNGGCLSERGQLVGSNGRWQKGNSCEVFEVNSGRRVCDLSNPSEPRAIYLVDDRLKSRVAWVVDPRPSSFAVEAWSF